MNKFKILVVLLLMAALLVAGGVSALAADGQGSEFGDDFNSPLFILPMTYWHT